MPNIHFIRAAIESATGIHLSLKETKEYLVSEGLITPAKAKNMLFKGYGDYYGEPIEQKEDEKVLDVLQYMDTNGQK